eukprot:scaffold33814_cov70-Attheya_sp.AAC.1
MTRNGYKFNLEGWSLSRVTMVARLREQIDGRIKLDLHPHPPQRRQQPAPFDRAYPSSGCLASLSPNLNPRVEVCRGRQHNDFLNL